MSIERIKQFLLLPELETLEIPKDSNGLSNGLSMIRISNATFSWNNIAKVTLKRVLSSKKKSPEPNESNNNQQPIRMKSSSVISVKSDVIKNKTSPISQTGSVVNPSTPLLNQ